MCGSDKVTDKSIDDGWINGLDRYEEKSQGGGYNIFVYGQ